MSGGAAAGPANALATALSAIDATPSVFTATMADQAERAAARSARRVAEGERIGPLDGMLVAVKDCFDIHGVPTTNGSIAAASPRAARDSAVVALLRRAGAVIVGKTNLSELAFSGLGTNPHFGTPANPLSEEEPLTPGGSSSGSAVAVATGIVPLAVGTDTSGSARVPAAFCGIAGYKSSERAFSRRGLHHLSPTLDSVGLLAPTVSDVRTALRELAPLGCPAPGPGPHRIVVPAGELVEQCTEGIQDAFHEQVRRLDRDPRFEVVALPLPVLDEAQALMDRHGTLVAVEAYRRFEHLLRDPAVNLLDPAVAARLRAAAETAPAGRRLYDELPRLRHRLRQQLGAGVLLCPTVRVPPPRIAEVLSSVPAFAAHNAKVLRTTMLLSFLGMPGVSIPMREAPTGVGMLISACYGRDHVALAVAEDIERTLGPVARAGASAALR